MTPNPSAASAPGLELGDIYYVLFRHKWKILVCSVAGILAAVGMYRADVPPYQSEAKLLVRYIISESKTTGPTVNSGTSKIMPDERGASIMTTETEILTSLDLARDVATAIGPEKILAKAGGGKDLTAATLYVKGNLNVNVPVASSVIHLTFRHPDPDMTQPILREIIDRYLKLHFEAHRGAGMLGDALAQEADTLRSRLAQTEDDLRKATNKAGVISLESAKEAYSSQMASIRREILGHEAELAGRVAIFEDMKKRLPSAATPAAKTEAEPDIPTAVIEDYKTLILRSSRLRAMEQEALVNGFTTASLRVKQIQTQLTETDTELKRIREQYPKLTRVNPTTEVATRGDVDPTEMASIWGQITSYQAKIKELTSQLDRLRKEAAALDQMEGTILELRRKKELDEQNYRYYAANLEQARISETLGNGKVSNIIPIQSPSPPFRDRVNVKKIGIAVAAGIFGGLAWAFLVELYFDRSVRRPVDLQRSTRAPLLLSIPQLKGLAAPARRALAAPGANGDANGSHDVVAEYNGRDFLLPFHETLRDRLIGYFESKNLTHKPKLIAVTSLRSAAGVTTTAAGLAKSLSETGEGNVLLVDMTASQGASQQFANGREVCGLDELLEGRSQATDRDNLFIVAEKSNSERLSRNLPQRFNKLVPKLKASEFDYIIFDMPTVSQLSITPRLAAFMDMVLLVVESEKTDRDIVQGACALLAESKAHVGLVLNKTKNYVPLRIQQQLLTS